MIKEKLYQEWQKQGLNSPPSVQQATLEYRKEVDILLQFIEDACIQGQDCKAPASKLYNHFCRWMHDNGMKAMTGTMFGRKMGEKFSKNKIGNTMHYFGIGILSDHN